MNRLKYNEYGKPRARRRPQAATPETDAARASGPDPKQIVSLTTLKHKLLRPLLEEATCPELKHRLHWAGEDAASLAFLTPWPCLFFPSLLAEQVAHAKVWVERQQAIRRRNNTTPLRPDPTDLNDRTLGNQPQAHDSDSRIERDKDQDRVNSGVDSGLSPSPSRTMTHHHDTAA